MRKKVTKIQTNMNSFAYHTYTKDSLFYMSIHFRDSAVSIKLQEHKIANAEVLSKLYIGYMIMFKT